MLLMGAILLSSLAGSSALAGSEAPASPETNPADESSPAAGNTMFLPLSLRGYPWDNPFGVEVNAYFTSGGTLIQRAEELHLGWARLNGRISWRQLQPNGPGDPINWTKLAKFEAELRALRAAGITPIVIVDDYPAWATNSSNCAPILPQHLGAFGNFLRKLVARYKTPGYNVHHWELGNEPDVALTSDNVYGCWGDASQPNFNGAAYGNMLNAVSGVIRSEDHLAQIWIGGLLLDMPETPGDALGEREDFLRGVLSAGAGNSFDILAVHTYSLYTGARIDHDTALPDNPWNAMGGILTGKLKLLRQIMAEYGVDKPIFVNEIAMNCVTEYQLCQDQQQAFFQMQADHLVRVIVRGLSQDVMGFTWYTLDGPGWRDGGLLADKTTPKPAFTAYRNLSQQLWHSKYLGVADYGVNLEGYAFQRASVKVHVVWARSNPATLIKIKVPQDKFVEAYKWDGTKLNPPLEEGNYVISVGFSPVFVIRNP